MYSAAQEQFGNNPFAQLFAGNGGRRDVLRATELFARDLENTTASRTENTDPLPNPWAPRGGATPTARPPTAAAAGGSANPGEQPSSNPTAGAAAANPSGLFSSLMQNDMSQLVQNPRLLESVLNAPYLQPLMDTMAANPELSRQMIGNNPMFANNPQLREQMLSSLPAMIEQMRNPEVQALMQNREALEAITQVQEGREKKTRSFGKSVRL